MKVLSHAQILPVEIRNCEREENGMIYMIILIYIVGVMITAFISNRTSLIPSGYDVEWAFCWFIGLLWLPFYGFWRLICRINNGYW